MNDDSELQKLKIGLKFMNGILKLRIILPISAIPKNWYLYVVLVHTFAHEPRLQNYDRSWEVMCVRGFQNPGTF